MTDIIKLLGDRLTVRESPSRQYLERATTALLATFERDTGLALPSSYQQWCLHFGPGELAGFYRIASPLKQSSQYELKEFDSQWRGTPEDDLWSSQIESSFLSGAFWFADTIGGESFVWQRQEPTDEVEHEYRIYYIPRHGPPEACARSFSDWLMNVCLTPDPERNWTPEWTFSRFQR